MRNLTVIFIEHVTNEKSRLSLKQINPVEKNSGLTDAGFDVCPDTISLTRDCLDEDITMKEMTRLTGKRDVTQVRVSDDVTRVRVSDDVTQVSGLQVGAC